MAAILGINCFSHDTAACLAVDGQVVAMAEQECFDRRCHSTAFPDAAIAFCLEQAGMRTDDLDVVAFAHRPLVETRSQRPPRIGRPHPGALNLWR